MQKQRIEEIKYSYTQTKLYLDSDFPIIMFTHNAKDDPLNILLCHDILEICLCLKGGGVFILDNRIVNYQKGDMIFINSNVYHRARSSNH